MWLLTNSVNQFEVDIKGDERYRQKAKVEFQYTGDGVDIIVSFYRNVCLLTVCQTPINN